MNELFEVKKLSKVYANRGIPFKALNNINMTIQRGEFLGIMGPSGAGKTTLLNILSTIDKGTDGEIIFEGNNLNLLKHRQLAALRKEKIGFIFQDFNLLDNMTIEDNIALPLALSGVKPAIIQEKVTEMAGFFNLTNCLKNYPYQASGGQKQRAAAARALITSPAVIFADEPTGALDSKSASELLGCLSKLNKTYNITVIMITHDAFAASYCRRIVFVKDGELHAHLQRDEERKVFYNRIINLLGSMGGEEHELF